MGSPRSRSRAPLLLLLLAAIVFVQIRAPYLSVPLERDEGEYAYIAQRMLAGEVPYRDAFDQKPPGIFVAYLVAFTLFGQSIESIHVFLYLWTAASAAALFALVRRLAGDLDAALSVLIFAVASADARLFAGAANTEHFLLLPMIASTWALVRGLESDGKTWWLLCGALAVLACWFKPVAATQLLFVAAAVACDRAARRAPRAAVGTGRSLLLLFAGGLAVSLPPCLYLAGRGAWHAFVDAVVLHNLQYAQALSLPVGVATLAQRFVAQAPSLAVFWLLAASALLAPRLAAPRTRALLAGWWVASFAGVSIGFYYRPHYFLQALPACCALAGIAAAAIVRGCRERGGRALGLAGVAGVLLAIVGPPVWANRAYLFAGSPAAVSRRIYGLNPFPESLELADHIRRTSAPGDAVFVVGSEPQILFYADRRSATRYIFLYPLLASHEGARARQREVIREVEEAKPLYVLWGGALSTTRDLPPGVASPLFDATREMLRRDYRVAVVARPFRDAGGGGFRFSYGDEARRQLERAGRPPELLPWIIVYRRET